ALLYVCVDRGPDAVGRVRALGSTPDSTLRVPPATSEASALSEQPSRHSTAPSLEDAAPV
ncbi:MAG: hypothetical protein AVDCRST_MAG60-55, partial [uncultured Nocardioides sp.]